MSLDTRVRTANVVLLHGQPGDRSDWDAVTARLPGSLTALALDRPGYGDNPEPAGSIEDNARWLLERLDHEGIDRAVLAGHSYGGAVALAAATIAPHRVRGLVLVSSVGPGCLTAWDELLAAPYAGTALALTAWSVLPWLARKGLDHSPAGTAAGTALALLAGVHHRHGPVWRSFLTEQREMMPGDLRVRSTSGSGSRCGRPARCSRSPWCAAAACACGDPCDRGHCGRYAALAASARMRDWTT